MAQAVKPGNCQQYRRRGFDHWVGKIPWRRTWQLTPVLLPGKSHGWRSLVGYSPLGCKQLDPTLRLSTPKLNDRYCLLEMPSFKQELTTHYCVTTKCWPIILNGCTSSVLLLLMPLLCAPRRNRVEQGVSLSLSPLILPGLLPREVKVPFQHLELI